MEAEDNVISNDINRDLCSLRAILESDEDEEESSMFIQVCKNCKSVHE